jgi:hypothetical protein
MNTVSPSPKGWLTHSSGVVPGSWGVHGGGDATGPGSVPLVVLLAVLLLAVLVRVAVALLLAAPCGPAPAA